VGGVQYAVQPYYNIGILPFLGFVSSGSFLRVIFAFIFVVPVNTPDRSRGSSTDATYIGCRARLLIQIRIEYSRGEASGTRQGSYATDHWSN
jgi:hypothetical protein